MAAALAKRRCYSLIAIVNFSLCGALGLPCLWQMLSYVHELSYKPMICSSPSSPLILRCDNMTIFLSIVIFLTIYDFHKVIVEQFYSIK